MADRPILFSAPMVLALLDGRKTQTRRGINSARVFATPERPAFTLSGDDLARAMQNADRFRHMGADSWFWESDAFEWQAPHTRTGWLAHIGYAPSDCLWVRETYYQFGHWEPVPGVLTKGGKQKWRFVPDSPTIHFTAPPVFANAMPRFGREAPFLYKRLGRFMPRTASRITLRVTGVKVERLQDISEADAIAEGVEKKGPLYTWPGSHHNSPPVSARTAFSMLWESINGAGSWDANPWVAAYTFEPIFANIDAIKPSDGGAP